MLCVGFVVYAIFSEEGGDLRMPIARGSGWLCYMKVAFFRPLRLKCHFKRRGVWRYYNFTKALDCADWSERQRM